MNDQTFSVFNPLNTQFTRCTLMHCEVPDLVNVNFQHNQLPETETAQLFSVVTCGGDFVLRDYFNTSV